VTVGPRVPQPEPQLKKEGSDVQRS
jgi:hypothetical protein